MANKTTKLTTASWLALAALVVAAPAVHAHDQPAAAVGAAARAAQPYARRLAVDEVHVQPLARGCVYQSRVRGTIEERATPDGLAPYRVGFAPDLRVRSFVRCERGDRRALEWERRVRGRAWTREQVAGQVTRVAQIVTGATGRPCLVAPTFDFDGRAFTATWVRQRCGRARGYGNATR